MEQDQARQAHRLSMPPQVRMPPAWEEVHAKSAMQQSLTGPRAGPPPKVGFPRAEDGLVQGSMMTTSGTSSVPGTSVPPSSPGNRYAGQNLPYGQPALGGSSKSGLNHTSTYFYGEAPIKPTLCEGNPYNAVGSYSMLGSQVCARPSARGAHPVARLLVHCVAAAAAVAHEPGFAASLTSAAAPSQRTSRSCLPARVDASARSRAPTLLCAGRLSPRLVGRLRLWHLDARAAWQHVHLARAPPSKLRQVLALARQVHAAVVARATGARLEGVVPVAFVWARGALRCRPARPARRADAWSRDLPRLRRRQEDAQVVLDDLPTRRRSRRRSAEARALMAWLAVHAGRQTHGE
jgi:hypothetical protein